MTTEMQKVAIFDLPFDAAATGAPHGVGLSTRRGWRRGILPLQASHVPLSLFRRVAFASLLRQRPTSSALVSEGKKDVSKRRELAEIAMGSIAAKHGLVVEPQTLCFPRLRYKGKECLPHRMSLDARALLLLLLAAGRDRSQLRRFPFAWSPICVAPSSH